MHRLTRLRLEALRTRHMQSGKWGYILAWLIGIPLPVLFLVYLLRGCT